MLQNGERQKVILKQIHKSKNLYIYLSNHFLHGDITIKIRENNKWVEYARIFFEDGKKYNILYDGYHVTHNILNSLDELNKKNDIYENAFTPEKIEIIEAYRVAKKLYESK
jgi:hypothetical protein